MHRPEWLTDPRFVSHESRWEHVDELNSAVATWILSKPIEDICRILDEAKLAYSFIYSVADMARDAQFQSRGMFEQAALPDGTPMKVPAGGACIAASIAVTVAPVAVIV